jgi:uncharacterized membrane protein
MSPVAAIGITMAAVFCAVRLLEAPANPATTIRILVSVVAVGVLLFARQHTMLQRATAFVALEALGGFIAFTYVDVPFIMSHQAQIGHLAITLYRDVHQAR